jgi:hypothetical protein
MGQTISMKRNENKYFDIQRCPCIIPAEGSLNTATVRCNATQCKSIEGAYRVVNPTYGKHALEHAADHLLSPTEDGMYFIFSKDIRGEVKDASLYPTDGELLTRLVYAVERHANDPTIPILDEKTGQPDLSAILPPDYCINVDPCDSIMQPWCCSTVKRTQNARMIQPEENTLEKKISAWNTFVTATGIVLFTCLVVYFVIMFMHWA